MNKSITQNNQKDKHISKSIKSHFARFNISPTMKAINAYKRKIPLIIGFFYIYFSLYFSTETYIRI